VEDSNSLSSRARNDADQRLLQRVVARDREAFRELYLGYHRRLARFLMRITRRHDLAEEVINDTMWAVWRQAATFRGESRVSTWIMSIAYRRALKALNQLKRAPSDSTVSPEDALLLAPDEVGESEVNEWILLGLERLPNEQRLVLELAYDFGYSCEEIARIVDCPTNTVKTRMFHARRKLRDILPELAGGDR
jgi:RNA polymerase sigma-70 factor, ECF subfamily